MGHLTRPADPFDAHWMTAAIALSERTRGRTAPNPNVGCIIVADGRVVGRGWTQPGGRPHAEAMALEAAGARARGGCAYVTLEPCAHDSERGPACSTSLIAAGIARVVVALIDPDVRTAGRGIARLRAAGIAVTTGVGEDGAREAMAGFLTRQRFARPFVTLKLATSLDGRIALADGTSRWITGAEARAHAHLERARHKTILVGRGTWGADAPRLDVRLAGLEDRAPVRVVLSRSIAASVPGPRRPGESRGLDDRGDADLEGPCLRRGDVGGDDVVVIPAPADIAGLPGDHLLIEGGAGAAGAFLAADLVDRVLLYRAPILIGAGQAAIGDIGLGSLDAAHGRWRPSDARALGSDRLEVYQRQR